MRREQEGFALIAAVAYLAIISAFVSAYLYEVRQAIDWAYDVERDVICRHIADAGIDFAIVELRADAAFDGIDDYAVGDGVVSVNVSRNGGAYRIESSGRLMDGSYEIHRVVRSARLQLASDGAVRALIYEAP